MMYLLLTESEVWGVFSTEKDAEAAKKELVDREFAEWLTNSCGKDELLAAATSEELILYNKGVIKIEEFNCYSRIYNDWGEYFYIAPIKLNKIQRINII